MFAVGRYDPRAEDAAATKKKERERERATVAEVVEEEEDNSETNQRTPGKGRPSGANDKHEDANDDNDSESSWLPSSDGSESSSLPSSSSSDGESDDESLDDNRKEPPSSPPSLKVIAPEQKFPAVGIKRRRAGLTDEGLDDFDMDLDESGRADGGEGGGDDDGKSAPMTDQQRLHNAEISAALEMSQLPIREAAKIWKLPPFLVSNLERDRYQNFFPIQSLVIPDVIASERHSQIRVRDICVSAPTGSGKTLAFVLPVLNALSNRTVRRLRALAVLPSRDLATQVYKVFKRYAEGSRLSVGLAIGQTDFEAEQKSLILGATSNKSSAAAAAASGDADFAVLRHAFNPTNPRFAMEAYNQSPGYFEEYDSGNSSALSTPLGGRSAVDILVATPGRLIDHLDKTPGFTLQHLRFLVIDEADRLLNQSYQGWIQRVAVAASSSHIMNQNGQRSVGASTPAADLKLSKDGASFIIDPITWRKSMTDDRSSITASTSRPVPLRKLLFSATLTRDPRKLASLGLVNPKHFDAHHLNVKAGITKASTGQGSQDHHLHPTQRYSVPESLSEYKIECAAEQKPLVLLALLLQHLSEASESGNEGAMVLVFTSSLDSTHRLARLLQLLWSAAQYGPTTAIAEFSSALSQKQRSKLMRQCAYPSNKKQKQDDRHRVCAIICSDGMSRGMDLPNVSCVVNYDVPRYAKTYVHRCGRTARAGKEGKAISVLKGGQVGEFVKMRQLIDNPDRVGEMGLQKELVSDAMKVYQACVRSLQHIIDAEENGELEAVAPLTTEWVPRGDVAESSKSSSSDEEGKG